MTARKDQLNFRISEEERARFQRVADKHGVTIPNAIRMLMKLDDDFDIARRYGKDDK